MPTAAINWPVYAVTAASLGLWVVLIGCARLDALIAGFGVTLVLLGAAEMADQFFETE